jgi:diadenosine tetraphosphate (Ap4A) HIT family hydrolase
VLGWWNGRHWGLKIPWLNKPWGFESPSEQLIFSVYDVRILGSLPFQLCCGGNALMLDWIEKKSFPKEARSIFNKLLIKNYMEEEIRAHCPHCDTTCWVFDYLLTNSSHFHVLCDVHPLLEGHLLIIPKRHTSCAGEYTAEEWKDFKNVYRETSNWVRRKFGSIATFEHGKIGQTVFHSHIHILPFQGNEGQIIPEGMDKCRSLQRVNDLVDVFQQEGQYLYFSIEQRQWVVDTSIGVPRFFRDRFAKALGCPQRGDWKATLKNPQLMSIGKEENERCRDKFHQDPCGFESRSDLIGN